jgi:hypothetical protein
MLSIPSHVFSDPRPAKLAGNQSNSGFHAWVGDPVDGGGGRLAELWRYQGSEYSCRDITE